MLSLIYLLGPGKQKNKQMGLCDHLLEVSTVTISIYAETEKVKAQSRLSGLGLRLRPRSVTWAATRAWSSDHMGSVNAVNDVFNSSDWIHPVVLLTIFDCRCCCWPDRFTPL